MFRHYFLPPFNELQFFCFPHSIGKYTRPDNHNVTREAGLKDFSLHFVIEGKGFIEVNGKTYTLKQGDAFVHVPHERMRYYTSEEDPWIIYWLQFNGSKLAEFLLERGIYETSIWTLHQSESLERAFLLLLEEIEANDIANPALLSTLTYSILAQFTTHAIPFSGRRSVSNVESIVSLLPRMQQEAHLPFVLSDWAEKSGLTPNYFCSLFKKVTKMTPLAYMTKYRIQMSKQLLLSDPLMPIHQVAFASGYPSASYFNKLFIEMEGTTPGEFRRNYTYPQAPKLLEDNNTSVAE
ncbi:AraC family transcriptional regulator [Paenibacillus sp. CCS19]|uniref:AraC family transcriptional regulator n=1 Tax=Paenibacillus sp. CCS19 TaxID=3158387 RepID=UPI0025609A17|nr:helix-turn-helix domain-containing protein [Paenibacillus cellulosilyticus]GMK38628.1 AraC family transcriptional regulator [Paenibacillus cellulosilyticus]